MDGAARWINLSLKLLVNRDLVGTKTFAIRAKEADPTMGYADEILAVVDTLMAGQQQQINGRYDWYAILRVERMCRDTEFIASEYRRLALLLNPQRNGLPFAEEAFGLVNEAWSVLSNPLRKSLYDNELSWLDSSSGSVGLGSGDGVRTHHQVQQHQFLPMQSQIQVQQQPQQQVVTPVRVQQQVATPLRARADLKQQHYQHPQQQAPQKAPYQPQFQPRPTQQVHFQQLTQQRRVQSQPVSQPLIQAQPFPQPRVQSQPLSQPHAQRLSQTQAQSQLVIQPQAHLPPQLQVQSRPVTQQQAQTQGHSRTQKQPQVQQHQQRQQEPNPVQVDQHPPMWKTPVRNMEEQEEVEVEEVETDPADGDEDEVLTFWTACPYCYHLFEYRNEYEDCTLRCQYKNCRRAFHGTAIAPPPESKSDKKAIFCSWGFFPIGASPAFLNSGKNESGKHGWHPFSPMFTCPTDPSKAVAPVTPNNWNRAQPKHKAVIVEDDDYVLMELSDSTDGSDTDWGSNSNRKKKKGRPPKVHKSPARKSARRGVVEKSRAGTSEAGDQVVVNNGITPDAFANDISKSGVNGNGSLSKKASGKNPKDLGKLDLNVEFNNEVEETMSTKTSTNGAETSTGPRTSTGAGTSAGTGTTSGADENTEAEGIGFFEGLDEFLNSLPILSAVGDDKVKAAG